MKRIEKAIDLRTLVAGFDGQFELAMDQLATEAEERNLRAAEMIAWARLNQTALRQRNA